MMLDSPLFKAELVYFVMVLFSSGQFGVETFRHPDTLVLVFSFCPFFECS